MAPVIPLALLMIALSGAPFASSRPASQEPESQESTKTGGEPTYKLRVERNVVLVHVVVRDSNGLVVKSLAKGDFKLFDDRKLQPITIFSEEVAAAEGQAPAGPERTPAGGAATPPVPPSFPQRYLALYFDNLNMDFADVAYARAAADRFLAVHLTPLDRVAVFESSGGPGLDFTDDRAKLHEALFKLRSRPRVDSRTECPAISDFQADRIVNFEDPQAFDLARDDALKRCRMDPRAVTDPFIKMQARRALVLFELQAHYSLQNLEKVLRRISFMPGQRNIIVVSAGFLPLGRQFLLGQLIDRALRSQVIISTLDPKGLTGSTPEGDASQSYAPSGLLGALQLSYSLSRETAASAPLAEIAEGTGGQFFHDNNDLDLGFRKVAAPPGTYYVLGFSPQHLKNDGRFHSLRVELVSRRGLSVQARRGYFAPKKSVNPEDEAKKEIDAALFSHQELAGLPVDIRMELHESTPGEEQLTVLVRVDVRTIEVRQEDGRKKLNDLTLVTALFDRDGKYLEGKKTQIDMRMRDADLQKLLHGGVKTSDTFTVKPGRYTVRHVVRESGSGALSALSREVDIPN